LPPLNPLLVVTAAYFAVCLVLGGGSRAGFLSDVALQALAVPLLLSAAWRLLDVAPTDGRRRARWAVLLCCAAVALPMAQLVPLPPSIWALLPARGDFADNLAAAGREIGWLPISVAPRATWLSALALLPPAALFLGVMQLGYEDRRRLTLVFLFMGMLGAGLGLLQVAQGSTSPLRFFAFTNSSETVGFFANRNHHAALLYCLLLMAAAWSVSAVANLAEANVAVGSRRAVPHVIAITLGFTVVVVLVAAQAMARSRAGLGLMIVALIGALAMAYAAPLGAGSAATGSHRGMASRTSSRFLLAAVSLALLFGAQFALYRIQARFGLDAVDDWRLHFARNTIEAAVAYMPFGSGMGTFVPVYQAFEKVSDNVANVYVNRAHNDFLEFWLEAGLAGLIAMALFLVWVAVVFLRVWRRGLDGAGYRDNLLAAAAVLSVVLLLAHSTVDYPLRTTALMAVFAFAAAMTLAPVGAARSSASGGKSDERRSRHEPEQVLGESDQLAVDQPRQGQFVPAQPRNDWPEAWLPPKDRDPKGDAG